MTDYRLTLTEKIKGKGRRLQGGGSSSALRTAVSDGVDAVDRLLAVLREAERKRMEKRRCPSGD